MKRILVISNNCFSKTNSNGRTLGNLFHCYDKKEIAQFYISGKEDEDFCTNYFNVSDGDVIRSVKPFSKRRKVTENTGNTSGGERRRNVKNMIIRNVIWNLGLWKTKAFKQWLDGFNPECVLLQIGDCAFMIRLTLWIAKRYNAKIFIYNSEGYYFKDYNYFGDGKDFLYKLFISSYRRQFERIMKKTSKVIYLCEELKDAYDKVFDQKGVVIYNSSSLEPTPVSNDDFPTVSYMGNLGGGREISLCEIGDVLQSIDPEYKLDVYGNAGEKELDEFSKHSGVAYKGFLNYDDVVATMEKSHILVHTESFSAFSVKSREFGFSGKIADSLASGRAFLVYAPEQVACVKYLKRNDTALVASSKEELKSVLEKALTDKTIYESIVEKQLILFKQNHDLVKNSQRFVVEINE